MRYRLGLLLLCIANLVVAVAGCRPENAGTPPAVEGRANETTVGRFFSDVTSACGIQFQHQVGSSRQYFFPEIMSPGAALLDYDLDGDLDIYLINGGDPSPAAAAESGSGTSPTNRLYRQLPDGRFTDATSESGLGDEGYGMGVAVGDVNNDGYPDVFVANYGLDKLFLNRGDGTFADVTAQAGIDNDRWSASASFVDFDRDGWLDLFVTNYVDYQPFQPCYDAAGQLDYCNPIVFPRTSDKLYRNLTGDAATAEHGGGGEVRFADVSVSSGIAAKSGAGLGVLCADFNGDRWQDIYVANDGHANFFWINRQDGTFGDEAVLLGAAYDGLGRGQASMGTALGDLNDDGEFDFLLTHLEGEANAVYLSAAGGGFDESSRAVGLAENSWPYTGFGASFVDFDHDGDLDLAVVNGRVRRQVGSGPDPRPESAPPGKTPGNTFWDAYAEPNQLFLNDGRGRFQLVRSPADSFLNPREVSRALAVGDVDNDGDVDMLLTNTAGPARLLRNDASGQGHWLGVRAVLPEHGNRDAYGARVTVHAGGRRWHRLIAPAASYLSSHDPRAHFGLGATATVSRIEVLWPDGSQELFPGTAADQYLVLQRGQGSAP